MNGFYWLTTCGVNKHVWQAENAENFHGGSQKESGGSRTCRESERETGKLSSDCLTVYYVMFRYFMLSLWLPRWKKRYKDSQTMLKTGMGGGGLGISPMVPFQAKTLRCEGCRWCFELWDDAYSKKNVFGKRVI